MTETGTRETIDSSTADSLYYGEDCRAKLAELLPLVKRMRLDELRAALRGLMEGVVELGEDKYHDLSGEVDEVRTCTCGEPITQSDAGWLHIVNPELTGAADHEADPGDGDDEEDEDEDGVPVCVCGAPVEQVGEKWVHIENPDLIIPGDHEPVVDDEKDEGERVRQEALRAAQGMRMDELIREIKVMSRGHDLADEYGGREPLVKRYVELATGALPVCHWC